ncbi:uncharacterized protein beat-IIb [Eurosta solidaginis]|uniref:uncharacterized protein beat-IIb n=1 Tax=Eurosta solidaginis TaxID=178769 RepID=UPI003530A9D9
MQTSPNTEVKCICASQNCGNTNNNNNKTYSNTKQNNNNNTQLFTSTNAATTTTTTSAKIVAGNMTAATIPAMATVKDGSGCSCCCKCCTFNGNAEATLCTTSMCNADVLHATPTNLTHCCYQQKDTKENDGLSKNNNKKKNIQHIPQQQKNAAVKRKDNFVASESVLVKDYKHSAVIRNSNNSNAAAAANVMSATVAATTAATTSIYRNFGIASWQQRMCAMLILLCCFALPDCAHAALSNVNLFIEPPAVRRGHSVILRCQYALEGAPLYSIKYYRGNYEFYRYTPGEFPNVKYFQYPGIKVDEHISNATQVVLRDVNFGLSGNFSCEVTADAPLFSTSTAYAQVQVVEFPEKRPQLFTEHARYEAGDILRANCSTPPSRPRADLHFTINNIPVTTDETQYIRTVDNLIASRLSLKLQLHAAHFAAAINTQHLMNHLGGGGSQSSIGVPYSTHNDGGIGIIGNGGLVLRCTAQIGDLYQEYKEIELGTPQKDPVPARVTLSSGSSIRNFFETYFSSAAASTTSSAAPATTRLPANNAVYPLKLTILTAALWRTQLLYEVVASIVVAIYNSLRLKQAANANR